MTMFDKIESMNPREENLARSGICPRCVPVEGRPETMEPLLDSGSIVYFQCRRCLAVWIVKKAKQSEYAALVAVADAAEAHQASKPGDEVKNWAALQAALKSLSDVRVTPNTTIKPIHDTHTCLNSNNTSNSKNP